MGRLGRKFVEWEAEQIFTELLIWKARQGGAKRVGKIAKQVGRSSKKRVAGLGGDVA